MAKISSNLNSWSNQAYELLNAINPLQISWLNRVSIFQDATLASNWSWTYLEASKDKLREKIQVCKDKAGIRGEKYPDSLDLWKKDVINLAEGVKSVDSLPSKASPKSELVYNHDIAKAITNNELNLLSRNVSTFANLWIIDTYLGSGKGVDSGVLIDLIAKSEKNPQKKISNMYLEHFSKKMKWGIARKLWIKTAYYFSSWIVSGVIHTTFQNVLAEMRLSTDGKIEPMFEKLLDHLEKFLKDYRGEKKLDDFTENKDVPELCKELSPFLVDEFFPETPYFKLFFGKLPFSSIPCKLLDLTIGASVNLGVRCIIRTFLPSLLQNLSETALASLTAPKSEVVNYQVNYRFAIPVVRFINDKLFGFANMLQEPAVDVIEPTPPLMAAKLEGVIDELMKLSTSPSNDPMIRDGVRNGLIDGGYQLMKFWQKEQENLLQQVLVLAGLPFTESQEVVDVKAEEEEFKVEWQKQGELVEVLSNRIFDIQVRQYCGTPSLKVNHHLAKEHQKIKRYLEEGLSDIIGLKSSLLKAREDLKKSSYQGFDLALNRHLIFWEGFLSAIKNSTKTHYPKPANEDLLREFLPLCQEGVAQIDKISELQDEWVLYTRHKDLKIHFHELSRLMEVKKLEQFDLEKVRRVLNKIEVLLPPNPSEVQILKKFVESFAALNSTEKLLEELVLMKNVLRKQGALFKKETLDQFKAFLLKNPELQKDKEFINLYNECQLLSRDSKVSALNFSFIQELSKKIQKEINANTQTFKDLQLNLLHRIHPSKKSSELQAPQSLNSFLREMNIWVGKKALGYGLLEKTSLGLLEKGTEELFDHVSLLEKKVRKMEPNPLYFPLENVLNVIEYGAGSLGKSWLLQSTKKNLIQDITGILEGVSPLIMAKEEEGKKRNLYSWIERLALYETVKYFKNKSSS